MAARMAINGLGRIGRAVFRIALDTPELEVVAVNDIVPADNLAYLLKYDTVYGRYHKHVEAEEDALIVDGKRYPVFNIKDPAELPWDEMNVDIAVESTGVFTREAEVRKHIEAGAKHAILSAPVRSSGSEAEMLTVVHGVNTPASAPQVISCASCTTNCITPVVEIMGRRIGIKKAIMTTVHAYTSSQSIVDSPSKSLRRGRAGAANLVPTSTGAAVATTKALPQYKGSFDGVAIRAPVTVGSIADITFITERETTKEEINDIFRQEAQSERYKDVVAVADDPIVSSDVIQDSHASIIDLNMTMVVGGDLVKIMSWYDNEWGYAAQLVREAVHVAQTEPAMAGAAP